MNIINFEQYLILRKLYKAKTSTTKLDPSTRNYMFLLDNELICSEYNYDGPVINLEPNGISNITNKGIEVYYGYFDVYKNRIISIVSLIISIIALLKSFNPPKQ